MGKNMVHTEAPLLMKGLHPKKPNKTEKTINQNISNAPNTAHTWVLGDVTPTSTAKNHHTKDH